MNTAGPRLAAAMVVLIAAGGCAPGASDSIPSPADSASAAPITTASSALTRAESMVLVGRIVTMDDPAVAEALLIEGGTVEDYGSTAVDARLGAVIHVSGTAFRPGKQSGARLK